MTHTPKRRMLNSMVRMDNPGMHDHRSARQGGAAIAPQKIGERARYMEKVTAVDATGEVVYSRDPSAESTPLKDAVAQLDGDGAVFLPERVVEADRLNRLGGIHLIPWRGKSTIEFTLTTGEGIIVSDAGRDLSGCHFHGEIVLDGSDQAARSSNEPAIRFAALGDHVSNFQVHGRLNFVNWARCVWVDTSHIFDSHWSVVNLAATDGEFLKNDDGANGWSIGLLTGNPQTAADPLIDIGAAGADLTIRQMNIGGPGGRVIRHSDTRSGNLTIDRFRYEPSTDPTGGDVIAAVGAGHLKVGRIQVQGGNAGNITLDEVVALAGTPENNFIGKITAQNTTLNNTVVDVGADTGSKTNIYEGPSADVTNSSGAALTHGVSALGDQTLVT